MAVGLECLLVSLAPDSRKAPRSQRWPAEMIPDSALAQLKVDRPCADVAAGWVPLRKYGARMVGPCPLCGGEKGNERFEATADGWVCAVCRDGGDVIKLVMLRQGLDFRGAVEWLGGARAIDPIDEDRLAKVRADKEAKRVADSEVYRQRERRTLYDVWNEARPAVGTRAEDYLRHRGLVLPPGARLRYVAMLPFYHGEEAGPDGRKRPRVIHRGGPWLRRSQTMPASFAGCTRPGSTSRSARAGPCSPIPRPASRSRRASSAARPPARISILLVRPSLAYHWRRPRDDARGVARASRDWPRSQRAWGRWILDRARSRQSRRQGHGHGGAPRAEGPRRPLAAGAGAGARPRRARDHATRQR
jgi:hypothetical protein